MDERAERERRYERGDDAWPLGSAEWEAAARDALTREAFDYLAGGAGEESTMEANRAAFERWRLAPRMLTGNAERDLSVEVLGTRSPVPFLLAPIGVQGIMHPDGELATADAAAATRVPMVVSSAASRSTEETAARLGEAPWWFQLYWVNDREVAASFVSRAEAAGARAIVLTVDTLTIGFRDRDQRNSAYLPFLEGEGIGQFVSDPVFRSRLSVPPEEDMAAAGMAMVAMFPHLALSWDDLGWLRERTGLPVLLKGILLGDDAVRARDAGAAGVVVSNHGGRQVDGEIAALDALPEVRDALGDAFPVLVDSGVRRASDILKALALGANAVLLGRPYAWGLAAGGSAGVRRVIETLRGELDVVTALCGLRRPTEADR